MTQVPADYLSTTSSYNYEQPLPSVARTSTVTNVPTAKKITFFKSGDPQFAGVKMAINQRSFKSFNALMDDLSHRVPLPFGVRTITTPRGIHCISELDQLEDGGCYLCSDKKYVKPISITSGGHRPGPPRNGRPSSTLRRAAQEGKFEDYSSPFTHHGPRIPKKITLVKNGETSFRRSIILNRRNARSFKTLLDEISEILQFPVKKLYTVDGRKIDSMQALLHCPSVLVCVGREPFKPLSMENLRKHSVEKLPDLAPRSNGNNVNENNDMNFGLKAKKSVIHPRSSSSNRSMRFSLSSEKSFPNGLAASPDNGTPFANSCSHPKPGDLVHSLVNDDIEKRVHVNKDGSLSVEMKVRFRLLNDETLQWSTQIKKSNLMNQMPCEESGVEDSGVDPIQKMNPEASSEADESLYPCDIDSYMSKLEESECDEAHCHNCGKKHQDYDIWKNPMHTSQRDEPSVRSTWHTRSSCSSTSSRRRVVHKKMASVDSLHTTSSEEFSEHIVQESSSYSETIENRVAYRSIKKCRCQSDLSTGASNGEDQKEYTRTSTSNSQRPSSLGLMSHSSCENNLDTQDAPEDHEANKTNSQNEDENCCEVSSVKCLKDDVEEVESSRVGSVMSRSSLQSRQSKKNVREETSSVGRSMSSSSLQKASQEDDTRCSTPANSVHSKSSNRPTSRAKTEQDDHSDNNAVVPSFSSESCPKKEAEEVETEQEENEISEVSSVSAKTKPSQPIRDESSEGERCSTQGTPHSRASDRNSKRNDSDEIVPCNASCSSRGSKRSKHSHIHLDAQSEMSVSSLGSTLNKKKNSLHADDLRSCSRASNYSKSSCEIKKKSIGDPMSHNSGSFHSNISSTSEAEPVTGFPEEKSLKSTTGYSESSRGSKNRSHREENSKPSSLCSSVSSPNGRPGQGQSKMNSEAASSRQGSMSESVCSNCDVSTETGIRNGNAASVSSRVTSKSEEKDKCLLTQISQESDDRCSQSNISQSSKSRQVKTRHLRVKMSNSSRASLSETLSVCSLHCPAPPKGKPSSKKIRSTMLKNSSISSIGTESVMDTGKEQKEMIDSSKATSYGSKSAATEVNDQKNEEIGDSCNRKVDEEGTDMHEEGSDLMPSTLPNTSPEEVVQEWLSKIPSETLLIKYEMEDGAEKECIEAATEVSYCTNAEETSEDEKAEKKNVEEAENEAKDEVGKETEEGTAINEEAEECMNQEQISEFVFEAVKADQAECSQSATSSHNNNRRDLPTSVQTSVQIMKALLSSKHETKFDRSNSLPEVSPTMGRKLSNSANILITCLAGLQLLDEESEDPSDKSKHLNKSRYMELLNIFQALWFGCTAEESGPSSGQETSEQEKTASGFKLPKSVGYDFTPMSSSGVDVSSGSGGSGEETTAGPKDRTSMAQQMAEFKSAGQVENVEAGTELTEVEEQSKEEVQSTRPSTACSKSKAEEEAQLTREESPIQEAEENKEDQCSNCENAQEEGRENENGEKENEENGNEENSKLAENGEQEEAEAVNDELPKENLEEEADQAATVNDTNVHDADCGAKLKAALEEQLEKVAPNDPKPSVNMATSMGTSLVQQKSVDPDPVWVLRLLKKIEKEFMAHYVSAMNEFKVRWNLENNQQMDDMILELKEEVSKRIQKSIEKELRKIKTRAGKKTPRPPDEPLQRESTLQTEQRRRRLQTMRKKSLFSDKNGSQSRLEDTSDLSFDIDEDTTFSAASEAGISKQSEEEYCPCDSCVRKKMASKPTRNPVVATSAPVMKAFDLQQILRLKKNDEEVCVSEAAQDIETIPRSSVEEAAENGNPNEENDEPRETEADGSEEKEPELNEVGSSMLDRDGEEPEISESRNCEMEDEAKDEETKEEEKEEAEEVGEEMKEREEEEEEEAKEEEEEKEEEEIMKAEEEQEIEEDADGEKKEKEDEEVKEESEEETKKEEEIKEEEEKGEEEEKVKEEEETKEKEEGEINEEEEEVGEKEEGTKEEEDMEKEDTKEEEEEEKEEEEDAKEEEEEVKEEEEETKEEEEDMKEEEEGTKDEEEDTKEEEEGTKDEEKDMKEEEEGTKDEEIGTKEEEEGTKDEEEDTKEQEEGAKDEEEDTKEEEEGTKDEEEDTKEEEEGTKDEEEDMKEEEEGTKDEEEGTKEEEEGTKDEEEDTKEKEEGTKDEEEDTKEEEKKDEEEDTKEEEEGAKDEEDTKEEEEGTKDEEEDTKEQEEGAKDEEEDTKEEEEGTKDEEEDTKEEEEGTKDEEEDMKEEEETKEEEEEVQEEEELTKEDEEAKKDEKETKQEEEEVEEKEENPEEEEKEAKEEKERANDEEETKEEEEEEAKEEKERANDEEETKEEEDEAKEEEEEQEEETQNEEQEADEKSKAEDEADNEAEEAEEQEDEDTGAADKEETSECRGDAGTDNNPEEDAAEGSEEVEQDEAVAAEGANPVSEDGACSAEEENNSEGDDKYDENDEEPTSDDPDKAHEKLEDKGNNKVSKKASKAKGQKTNKWLETLNKVAASSCYSSMGNFSQQSQKGSEDEGEEECKDDDNPMNDHSNGEVQSGDSSKPSQMYPDSEEEEEDKASSCTDPQGDGDQADAEGADPKESEHTEEVQASKKKEDSDEIDQDDLDF